MRKRRFCLMIFLLPATLLNLIQGQESKRAFTVTAYYSGNPEEVDNYEAEKLTHIIFSFCHLRGNLLRVDDAKDSLTIQKLVALKKRNASLKVLLSLGGWGGCQTCSDVFKNEKNRIAFASSVKELCDYFGTDGIDLDWEYPAIPGYPGHTYSPADKENFTELVRQLRRTMGSTAEVTFAAGGFPGYIEKAIDWKQVMPLVDRVNVMTYDLIHGYDTVTGHHTALYSTPHQSLSTVAAVEQLLANGVARDKIVIGAAFYARVWENVPAFNNGLYQPGKFKSSVGFKNFEAQFSPEKGFVSFRDTIARAPYMYNAARKLFVTYDDEASMREKTRYALDQGLNGIMFWELTHDKHSNGLVNAISVELRKK